MPLTLEQEEEWNALKVEHPRVHEGQTPEQARAAFIYSFQHVCALEGLPIPSDDDLAAELDKLHA